MKFKRIGRVLVCLLLVSALLINASPIKAKATGAVIAAPIVKAATVTLNPYIAVGAIVLALGIGAVAENPQAFQNVVDAGVSALEFAGTWVKDGMVELLRTEDADGNASYYVDSGLLDSVCNWAYSDSSIIRSNASVRTYLPKGTSYSGYKMDTDSVALKWFTYTQSGTDQVKFNKYHVIFTLTPNYQYVGGYRADSLIGVGDDVYWYKTISVSNSSWSVKNDSESIQHSIASNCDGFGYISGSPSFYDVFVGYGFTDYSSSFDISIGALPTIGTDLTDGTSARQWSEEYTDRGLKVYGGGSGNNNNDGKWFWKVIIPTTAATLYAMSQADQWSGETPKEFDDYTSKTEYEILSQPEIEFGHGIEIQPVTSPTPDSGGGTDPTQPGEGDNPGESTQPTTPGGLPDIGGGDNPDSGGDSNTGTESGNQTDYTNWFERIIKGIEELPSKFADWFHNIATQLERIIEGITTLGQNFAQNLQTLGQNIVEGIRNVISSLFSPSENYLENKVQALKDKHYNLAQFTELGNNLKAFFAGLGSKPPIIYIDLGAATGSYLWGGRQIFLDLTWYAEYKPKMDFILGGIIWLWLAWRVFLAIPGIISGMPGESGSPDISIGTHYIPPVPGQGALPPGQKKRRSK